MNPTEIVKAAELPAALQSKIAEALLVERLDDAGLARVRRGFAIEAAREPMDERSALLVAAAAEAMLVDRSPGELGAVLRMLRDLECQDVQEQRAEQHGAARRAVQREAAADTAGDLVTIEQEWQVTPRPAFLTPRGELLVEVTRAWLAEPAAA